MRQFARLTLSAPIPEDTTIMDFRHLLEKYQLAPAILAVINGYLQEKGLLLRQGTIHQAPLCLRESTLLWADEKHGPTDHAVRPVEPVDGSKTTDGIGGVARSTRKTGQKALCRTLR
ncbi:IS5 family transposase [Pseudomonas plecoglossicida]